jgi:hypothetical protein
MIESIAHLIIDGLCAYSFREMLPESSISFDPIVCIERSDERPYCLGAMMSIDRDNKSQVDKKTFLQRWIGWRAIAVFVFLMLILSPFIYRGYQLGQVPDFPEPFDQEPLLEYSIPDDENAMYGFRSAMTLYVQPTPEARELRDEIGIGRLRLPNDVMDQFLKDNEPALFVWKQATEMEESLYIPAREYDLSVSLDLVQDLREVQRTVMLLCHKLQSEGKTQEAGEWYRSALRASRHIGKNGGLIERLVGITCFQHTAVGLTEWAAVPDLTSEDLKIVHHQIQEDWMLTEKTSTALKLEYLSMMKMIELADLEGWDYYFDVEILKSVLYLKGEPGLGQRILRFYFFDLLRSCDFPRRERQRIANETIVNFDGIEWSNEEFNRSLKKSSIAGLLLPSTSQFQTAIDREEVHYRCLLVALAAQAYFRDHGEFPADASQLVPKYLEEIPDDLYSPTPAPLIYRRNGIDAVVYSVFENELDDGGNEVNYDEIVSWGNLLDSGFRIRNPFDQPLIAPKS